MATFDRRGKSGGRFRQIFPQSAAPALPKPETSQARIQKLAVASILSSAYNDKVKIENVQYIASFSWKDTRNPTILVPGKPPRWQPLSTVQVLSQDSGSYHRDPNSARFPSFPLEPAIRAIHQTAPGFEFSDIDVFGCGNTIGGLLSFARDEERTFRFGAELIGSCLFLVRKTDKLGELIDNVQGYGHTFPEAYTQWDRHVRGSVSHQRIIKYDFAGLKCLIRSETDGYLPDLVDEATITTGDDVVEEDDDDDTSGPDRLLRLALGLQTPSQGTALILRRAGEAVPQRAIFDLKTRALVRKQDISVQDFLHRLWVNQTPNLILAYHTRGKFSPNDIDIIDVRRKLTEWETSNAVVLSKLGGVLHKLIKVAKRNNRPCFEVRRIQNGPLEIWSEVPQWSALPNDLKRSMGQNVSHHNPSVEDKATQKEEQDDDDEEAEYLKF